MIRHATRWLPTDESRTVYYHIICRLSFRSLRQSKATIKIEQIPDQFILGVLNMLFLLKVCRSSLLLWPDSFQNYTCKKPFTSSEKNICSARVCEWAILRDISVEREGERERERAKRKSHWKILFFLSKMLNTIRLSRIIECDFTSKYYIIHLIILSANFKQCAF